jgi:hypothetical protein
MLPFCYSSIGGATAIVPCAPFLIVSAILILASKVLYSIRVVEKRKRLLALKINSTAIITVCSVAALLAMSFVDGMDYDIIAWYAGCFWFVALADLGLKKMKRPRLRKALAAVGLIALAFTIARPFIRIELVRMIESYHGK